jgi:hypothetical protein
MDALQLLLNGLAEAIVSFAQSSLNAANAVVNNSVDWLQDLGVIALAFMNDLAGIIIAFLSA